MKLAINDLSKTYANGVKALQNVSLSISSGMFGLLGPNGAGKSSLMRTIATLQEPDSGSIFLDTLDVLQNKMDLRKKLGYLPQEFGVYPRISAEKLLSYLAHLKGISHKNERNKLIDYCLEVTNLQKVKKLAVSSFSGGMKQRFGIAQILLNNPKLIIVDEPTAGLDPAERLRFLNILREISHQAIVIFSTHIVEDIHNLCTDMAILNKGKVVLHKSPEKALDLLDGKIFQTAIESHKLPIIELNHHVLSSSFMRNGFIAVRVYAEVCPNDSFVQIEPSLEDVYFAFQSNLIHS